VRSIQTAVKPGVSLATSLDLNLPTTAFGDPLRYRQVVQNLITNAVKFTESGSIDVHASLVEEDETSFTIRTEITDTGIGIEDVAIGSLFNPFTQFDTSATKRYKGTGLGLSICKSLAELMGGAIGFHPNPKEQGSVFWFTAKLGKINILNRVDRLSAKFEASVLSPAPDSLELVRELAPGKRVLLAEDNFINQKVMLVGPGRESLFYFLTVPLFFDSLPETMSHCPKYPRPISIKICLHFPCPDDAQGFRIRQCRYSDEWSRGGGSSQTKAFVLRSHSNGY
jgi:osomolarity two-component system, sensor histidine kinase TcsA